MGAETPNSVFSFVTPTEFVDLPSGGRFYPKEHPLHGVDVVEIRHMTAKEEDILTSESLLKKGLAIDRLLQSVVIDKTIQIDSLLVGDKNALLMASRITGFGSLYETTVKCPVCRETNELVFNLEELGTRDGSELPEGVTVDDDGHFSFTLPQTGAELKVRLLTSRDERNLTQAAEKKKRMKMPDSRSTDLLKAVVVSVSGHTDPAALSQFVEMMPLQDVKHLRTTYEQIKPDLDIAYPFDCEHCSHEGEVQMPLTAQFFWPNT
tara:strand:- start:4813 stop:5604 length:792 start_codon:yes stop_codon:yes gene_type:complete